MIPRMGAFFDALLQFIVPVRSVEVFHLKWNHRRHQYHLLHSQSILCEIDRCRGHHCRRFHGRARYCVLPHRIAHNAILVDDKSNSRKRSPPPTNPYHSAGLNNDDNRPRILGWRRVRGRRVWGVRHPSSDERPICVIVLLCDGFLLFLLLLFFLPSNFAAAAFRAMSAESKSSFSTAATWERLRLICMMARPSVDDDAMEDDAEDVAAEEEEEEVAVEKTFEPINGTGTRAVGR